MFKPIVLAVAATVIAAAPADAQQQRRSDRAQGQQQTSDQRGNDMQRMVKELNQLIDAADRDRAANPDFIRDLRRVLDQYAGGSARVVFRDEFRDGNYTANPAWRVLSGSWRVDATSGLRSRVVAQQQQQQQQGQQSTEQLLLGLADSFLRQRTGEQRPQRASAQDAVAAIAIDQRVGNAATIEMLVTDHTGQGQLETRLFQGGGDSGYRMVYSPGERATVSIHRSTGSGSQVVESSSLRPLPLGQQRRITWTRDSNGNMRVSVGNDTVLQTSDRAFNDAWSGVMLVNAGGDYSIRSITASDRG